MPNLLSAILALSVEEVAKLQYKIQLSIETTAKMNAPAIPDPKHAVAKLKTTDLQS